MNLPETEAALLLKSRKLEDRLRGLRKLQALPPEDRWRLAISRLSDASHFVAAEAVERLLDCDDWKLAAQLQQHFDRLTEGGAKSDPGCHIRAKLAYLFGHQEYSPAGDSLKAGLRTRQIEAVGGVPFDTAAHLRANCALALASLRTPDALRDISLLLFGSGGSLDLANRHLSMEPRKAAAQALGILGDPAGVVPLSLKLAYPAREEADVLQECMASLIELRDERVVEFLTPYLSHEDAGLAGYAAFMLARSGKPEAVTELMKSAAEARESRLKVLVLALVTMRTEESEAQLRLLEQSEVERIRRVVAEINAELERG